MKIIANPRAGHGKGARNIQALRDAIRRRGRDDTVLLTERAGHATEIARELAGNEPRIAVLGGDGTIGEVADALTGSGTELAILSVGTGNDVARSLGLPLNDLETSLDVAFDGQVREIDVGWERDRHFVSVLGVGFPAVVAEQANHTRLQGSAAFFVAVYRAMSRLEPVSM
ncbi:MAG: diacylglycerol/lipid kinase family protein, partial [Actinomycetota bacterium]